MLRTIGFTRFEARNAYGHHDGVIWVVNFQSFNAYDAAVLGCTTFSFGVNLGVYVLGQLQAGRIPRDKDGRLQPPEYACEFRHQLCKRTPVDLFTRKDIFFIDADGNTTGPCFEELRWLVDHEVPGWFERHNRRDELIRQMELKETQPEASKVSTPSTPGSYNWRRLKSLLLVLEHEAKPGAASANKTVECLDGLIGVVLDFSTIQSTRSYEERHAKDVRELWEHLGVFGPKPAYTGLVQNTGRHLDSPAWGKGDTTYVTGTAEAASARVWLWPMLRRAGFSVFTDRLAHRVSEEFLEVVEVLPMDEAERKACNFPRGLFRIGFGLFWTGLRGKSWVRTDKNGCPRPVVNESHVSNWLTPRTDPVAGAGAVFQSSEDALDAVREQGMRGSRF